MAGGFAAANNGSRLSTVLCCLTLSPTTPQVTPFGLRKSIWGSVTTSAVRSKFSFMFDGGSIGLLGSAYLSVAAAESVTGEDTANEDAMAAVIPAAAPAFRKLRRVESSATACPG